MLTHYIQTQLNKSKELTRFVQRGNPARLVLGKNISKFILILKTSTRHLTFPCCQHLIMHLVISKSCLGGVRNQKTWCWKRTSSILRSTKHIQQQNSLIAMMSCAKFTTRLNHCEHLLFFQQIYLYFRIPGKITFSLEWKIWSNGVVCPPIIT